MVTLHILSGGAAQGLVRALSDDFESLHGLHLSGTFGAVGAMKQKLLDGAPCDVLILTRPMVQDLVKQGHAIEGSAHDIGVVKTGVAVLAGQAPVAVATPDALRQALLKASAIYFPDPQLATAGIHFMKVMQKLGVADELAPRLRPHPNGATAMKAMGLSKDPKAIGCTQVTEILSTPGVQLVGDLPKAHELATVYTAVLAKRARQVDMAQVLIAYLVNPALAELRAELGFLPA
jgi:molybdate transport system substrate-binding protein